MDILTDLSDRQVEAIAISVFRMQPNLLPETLRVQRVKDALRRAMAGRGINFNKVRFEDQHRAAMLELKGSLAQRYLTISPSR